MDQIIKLKLNLARDEKIPDKLLDKESIIYLEIFAHKIKEIPPLLKSQLQKLVNLEYLCFSNANLESLKPDFFCFRKLKTLKLKNCSLKILPEGLVHMPLLESIDLSHNQLLEIPSWINTLPYLQNLNLGHNLFHSLPSALFKLKSLKRLNLDSNHLGHFSAEELAFLGQLQHLSLDGNLFSEDEKKEVMNSLGIWF